MNSKKVKANYLVWGLCVVGAGLSLYLTMRMPAAEMLDSRNIVFQQSENDCGVAATKNILLAFGRNPDSADSLLSAKNDGVTLLEIKKTLTQCGLTAKGYKTTFAELTTLGLPAIAHINENHFVVLETIESESVVLIDPSMGRLKYQASAFEKKWNGILLCVSEKP